MAEYMTPEREEYIAKLDEQIQVIDRILKMDLGSVVSAELKKQLKKLKTEAETVQRKLINNEFEIAIVGEESSGKSTFANALMGNSILPRADKRCTYTSTRIAYSGDDSEDSAVVSFYTVDEFDSDFKDKLRQLCFPNYEMYSFDTLDYSKYKAIYDSDVPDDVKDRKNTDSIKPTSSTCTDEDGEEFNIIDQIDSGEYTVDGIVHHENAKEFLDLLELVYDELQERQKPMIAMLITTKIAVLVNEVTGLLEYAKQKAYYDDDIFIESLQRGEQIQAKEIAMRCGVFEASASRSWKTFKDKLKIGISRRN